MKSFFSILFLAFLLVPLASHAHQPRTVDSLIVDVEEPSVSKAYYDALEGEPVVYRIESTESFPLYVGILAPDVEGARTDFVVTIEREGEESNELLGMLEGGEWIQWYEPYGDDWYLLGPEYPTDTIARGELPQGEMVEAGVYLVTVTNPDNEGAYALAIGEEEIFPVDEIVNAVLITPVLDRTFFGTTSLSGLFLIPILFMAIYMLFWFVVSLVKKKMSVVDTAWGLGFVCVAWLVAGLYGVEGVEQWIVLGLVSVWGLRLAYHITKRNWGKPEDVRYANWRKEWGKWVIPRSFFQVFVLQGLLLLVIASSFIVTLGTAAVPDALPWQIAGLVVWCVGFFFEAVGDWQLKQFLADPKNKGKLMTQGLWRYTRHPNYFGEATMWWGIWLLGFGHPYWGWLVISPIVITMLVRFVSGVPMLEKLFVGKPGWDAYTKQTNVFIPWFPKK